MEELSLQKRILNLSRTLANVESQLYRYNEQRNSLIQSLNVIEQIQKQETTKDDKKTNDCRPTEN